MTEKIVDWDVKPQHKQTNKQTLGARGEQRSLIVALPGSFQCFLIIMSEMIMNAEKSS